MVSVSYVHASLLLILSINPDCAYIKSVYPESNFTRLYGTSKYREVVHRCHSTNATDLGMRNPWQRSLAAIKVPSTATYATRTVAAQ